MEDQPLQTRELFKEFVVPTYGRFDVQLERGEGAHVWDESGKRYLDFGAGIAVTSVGHSHPRLAAAVFAQMQRLVHTSNLYQTRLQGQLAERLVGCVGAPGKIFFCNSGAEANEALYKLARKFGNEALPPPPRHSAGMLVEAPISRHGMITMEGSFHGRTLGGIAATGQDKVKKGFEPILPGFQHVPFNDLPALLAAVQDPNTVAILLEPIQGEIGIRPATPEFLRHARDLCDRHQLLLFFDEVQCGLGRTGDWCAWKSILGTDEILPDGVSWAKGIAGGVPMGAVWIRNRPVQLKSGKETVLSDLLGPGSHGTTFGGTPLVCAAGLEVIRIIEDEGLLENARIQGALALDSLRRIGSPLIREVRGVGLMLAFELAGDLATRLPEGRLPSIHVVEALHAEGLLTVPSGPRAVRWLPPLNVTASQISEATEITAKVLAHCA
ncbi:MAG: Succinylornithine transaminase/acetylornithine aminotransferase [Verrucomicrobiota bacterium]|jgi:acetylornithine/succinyldiaminopimelate/putrescine aminotransferase